MTETISAEARLRERNQLTIPEVIVAATGLEPGVTLVVETRLEDPDTLVLRRVRRSYAGALRGVYGDATAYVEGERKGWT
jgi:bifunctional DNA-binding transcriptional regulator/antitoxin component of YhaV-PrlF toxin-antitoxin module